MRATCWLQKPFRFTGRSFAAGSLLRRKFESCIGDGGMTNLGPTQSKLRHHADAHRVSSNSCEKRRITLALKNATAPLSIADRVATMYTHQIQQQEARQRHVAAAELALIRQLHTRSSEDNGKTWVELKEQYNGIFDFTGVDAMSEVFDAKELRVVGVSAETGSLTISYADKMPQKTQRQKVSPDNGEAPKKRKYTRRSTNAATDTTATSRALSPARVVDTATLQRQGYAELTLLQAAAAAKVVIAAAEMKPLAFERKIPLSPRELETVQVDSNFEQPLFGSPEADEEESVTAASVLTPSVLSVGPLMAMPLPLLGMSLPLQNPALMSRADPSSVMAGDAPILLEKLVSPLVVAAVRESGEMQEQAMQRRQRKLASVLKKASSREIASVLSSALQRSDLDRISKKLTKKNQPLTQRSITPPIQRSSKNKKCEGGKPTTKERSTKKRTDPSSRSANTEAARN